jgi:anti-sigma B factor antagonist
MQLDKEKKGDIWVLTPRKDLMGGEETRVLEQAIRDIVAEGTPKIICDLGRISYLNSTGLGSLVAAHMSCQNRSGFMRLANISKRISNLFIITKLAFVFETFDSVDEAVAGINRSSVKSQE